MSTVGNGSYTRTTSPHSASNLAKAPLMVVLDRGGNHLGSLGSGAVVDVHGIYLSPDDHMYVADKTEHVAVKLTLDGRPPLVLGTRVSLWIQARLNL